jgi:radical SAM protein with 4Fe4S-binding SPASM domain
MVSGRHRHLNVIRLGSSQVFSALTGKPLVWGMPFSVSAELTNVCNLRCPECASGSGLSGREKGSMDPELYKRIIKELGPYLFSINLYFQGEPMIHPRFFEFLELTGKIRSVVSTNGHFLSPENSEKIVLSGLGKLIVSLDGMDQATYSKYRAGGDFINVKNGIRIVAAAIARTGSPLKLEIQFLVNRYNEGQLKELRKFASETGAVLKLKSMQVIDMMEAERWMPVKKQFRRYTRINGIYKIKSRLPDRCMRLWFNPVITWDGKVLPCCFDKNEEFVMGDLNKETFEDIWNGREYKEFRENILSGRSKISICRNCTESLYGAKS